MANTPISDFPAASSVNASDVLAGVQDDVTKKFSFAIVLNWLKQQLGSLFVPTSREINGKALDADIALDASDVGAVDTADVGVADGVASLDSNGKVPGTQLDLSGKQSTITANGILKGDGQGGVSAATAGTDYGTYSKPSGGIPSTDMTSAVQTSLGKADTAYQKPSSGIPSSDMASGVQTSLGKADTAYQKPSGGIPASDLANGVIPTVPSAYTSNPAMDGTASPGNTGEWADGGHVHPNDTSRVPVHGMGKNLLDNAYFIGGGTTGAFPVNQRGQLNYASTGLTIDRWHNERTTHSLTVASDYIRWERVAGNYNPSLFQAFETALPSGTYTFSMLYRATMRRCRIFGQYIDPSDGWTLFSTTYTGSVTGASIQDMSVSSGLDDTGKYLDIKACKLEIGTEQTLCHNEGTAEAPVWALNEIPNYQQELAKCQRYLWAINYATEDKIIAIGYAGDATTGVFVINLPQPMCESVTPTFVGSTPRVWRNSGNSNTNASTVSAINVNGSVASISVTIASSTRGEGLRLVNTRNSVFGISREI